MNTTQLILGLVFSAIGLSYFMYGKKRGNPLVRFTGLGLMVYPYFVDGTLLIIVVGLLLMVLPSFYSRFFE
ncbi:MAG: hypothetical protein U1F46_01430 [Marinagarivorans sp.]